MITAISSRLIEVVGKLIRIGLSANSDLIVKVFFTLFDNSFLILKVF